MKRTFLFLAFCVTLNLIFTPKVQADDAFDKLGRGITNVLTGWGEIPRETIRAWEDKGGAATFTGLIRGIVFTVARTVVGVYEIVTFPFPSYEVVLKPEYVFSNMLVPEIY